MDQAMNACIAGLNNVGQSFWSYAAGVFIQSSVLIVLLLVVDFLLRKRTRALFRYCLWMLLFVKLMLPVSFTMPTGVGYWVGEYFNSRNLAEVVVPQSLPMVFDIAQEYVVSDVVVVDEVVATGVELEPICWQGLVFLAWLVGVLVLLAVFVQRICFVRGLVAQAKPANAWLLETLEQCRRQIGIRRNIELKLTGNSLSPAVCGLFKPVILMPADLLEKLSREKLKAVLIHELAHIKRADIWVNLLQTMLQIAYFYNPLVWIANAMVRSVREQAVDEMVLVAFGGESKSYSNVLIDIAEMVFSKPGFGLRLIGVVESKKALQGRITHMLNRRLPKSSRLGVWGLLVIVIFGIVILPMGCSPVQKTDLEPYIPTTSTINEQGHIVDKLDYPFVNDPQLIGTWEAIDFVAEMDQFKADEKQWKAEELCLKELIFLPNGRTFRPWLTWTKGLVFHSGDRTASKYILKEIGGSTYMFYEWKSGDYTIRHGKPSYYVLKKTSSETGGLAEGWASQPSDAEFAKQLPAKIEQLDIDNAGLEQVKEIFGKPAQYIWGSENFTEDNLPRQYILPYPSGFSIYMRENKIIEIRHESGSKYVYRDKLQLGSTLDEVFEVVGEPEKTVEDEKNYFEDGVLYKDVDGRKGYCYYARSDQDVRLWFMDYKLSAIYMTRSDYGQRTAAKEAAVPAEVQQQSKYICPFIITGQGFIGDDWIEITKISGTSSRLEVGQTYTIEGKYKLSSCDEAMLHLYATNGETRSKQGPNVKRGAGEFARTFTYVGEGWLHLSFYPVDGGSSFANLYFVGKGSNQQMPGAAIIKPVRTSKSRESRAKCRGKLRIEFSKAIKDLSSNRLVEHTRVSREFTYSNLINREVIVPDEVAEQMTKNGLSFDGIIKMLEEGVGTVNLLDIEEMYEEKAEEGGEGLFITVQVTMRVNQ